MTALETNWRELAACKGLDPDLFFPRPGEDPRPAKAVCADCPVRDVCLEQAIADGEYHGIFGGLSEKERRRVRRKRASPMFSTVGSCQVCGKDFPKRSANHRSCSDECSTTAQKRRQHEWEVARRG